MSTNKKIGETEIMRAAAILKRYREGKANLEKRIVSNEQWWKMRHWGELPLDEYDRGRPRPASAWLFNSIANKHADAMDNIPEPVVLPREQSDRECASQLSKILPALLERCDYERLYSDMWWYKLKNGSCCQAVLWDPELADGAGDISIKNIDILNLFWEPGIKDIQQSPNLFYVSLCDNDLLIGQYPQLEGKLGDSGMLTGYKYDDNVDNSEKTAVIDWYYKKYVNGEKQLHYCRFVGNTVLYSSENDEACAHGFYAHGQYPFVIDSLFSVEGSPCGFGYIDVMRDAQMYIDRLGQVLLEHTISMGRKRFFIKNNSAIKEDEFADWRRPFVHVAGNISDDDIREIKIDPLDPAVMPALNLKIQELKETSGNRDFSQGGTSNGVTAASAIAALQEAGNKLSRDMLKGSYDAFSKVCCLMIELIREFYDEPRSFRITGGFADFGGEMLAAKPITAFGIDFGSKKPVFDIICRAAKKSPFSKAAQNELAKELFSLGFFNPELSGQALACLDMMDFEGKESIVRMIKENAAQPAAKGGEDI